MFSLAPTRRTAAPSTPKLGGVAEAALVSAPLTHAPHAQLRSETLGSNRNLSDAMECGGKRIWLHILLLFALTLLLLPADLVSTQRTATYSSVATILGSGSQIWELTTYADTLFMAHWYTVGVSRWNMTNNTMIRSYNYTDNLWSVTVHRGCFGVLNHGEDFLFSE
jgi:hypothetical protein